MSTPASAELMDTSSLSFSVTPSTSAFGCLASATIALHARRRLRPQCEWRDARDREGIWQLFTDQTPQGCRVNDGEKWQARAVYAVLESPCISEGPPIVLTTFSSLIALFVNMLARPETELPQPRTKIWLIIDRLIRSHLISPPVSHCRTNNWRGAPAAARSQI